MNAVGAFIWRHGWAFALALWVIALHAYQVYEGVFSEYPLLLGDAGVFLVNGLKPFGGFDPANLANTHHHPPLNPGLLFQPFAWAFDCSFGGGNMAGCSGALRLYAVVASPIAPLGMYFLWRRWFSRRTSALIIGGSVAIFNASLFAGQFSSMLAYAALFVFVRAALDYWLDGDKRLSWAILLAPTIIAASSGSTSFTFAFIFAAWSLVIWVKTRRINWKVTVFPVVLACAVMGWYYVGAYISGVSDAGAPCVYLPEAYKTVASEWFFATCERFPIIHHAFVRTTQLSLIMAVPFMLTVLVVAPDFLVARIFPPVSTDRVVRRTFRPTSRAIAMIVLIVAIGGSERETQVISESQIWKMTHAKAEAVHEFRQPGESWLFSGWASHIVYGAVYGGFHHTTSLVMVRDVTGYALAGLIGEERRQDALANSGVSKAIVMDMPIDVVCPSCDQIRFADAKIRELYSPPDFCGEKHGFDFCVYSLSREENVLKSGANAE